MILAHLVLFKFFAGAGEVAAPVVVAEQRGGGRDRRIQYTKRKLPRSQWEIEEIARRQAEEETIQKTAPVLEKKLERALVPVFDINRLTLEVIERIMAASVVIVAKPQTVVTERNAMTVEDEFGLDDDEILAVLGELL